MLTVYMSTGVLLYAGIGVVCLLLGANYLDYGILPVTEPRSVGMLVIEIGVGITVMAAVLSIFPRPVDFRVTTPWIQCSTSSSATSTPSPTSS